MTTEAAVLVRAVRTAGRQVPVVLPPPPDPRLHLAAVGMVAAIWVTFAACTGLLAATGHCMTARWHVGQVCGGSFWSVLALPPEILVFMFFMITDPKTTPDSRRPRALYGASVAFLAALLVAPARTEFSTKVGVLAGPVVVCAGSP